MTAVSSVNDRIIAEFRANGGRVGGVFEGSDLLLLTTSGAGTGRKLTNPVGYERDGARLLVFGSDHHQDRRPGWYHNLVVDPAVTVEIGGAGGIETIPAHAVPLPHEERDRVFAAHGVDTVAHEEQDVPVIALYPTQGVDGRVAALGDHLVTVHDMFRRQLAAARRGVRLGGRDLRQHCLAFCLDLQEHHTREDGFFPEVQALVPGLAPVLDRLRAEHEVVAGHIRRFRELLDGPPGPDVDAQLEALAADVEAHFEYEERMLVPVLNMAPAH